MGNFCSGPSATATAEADQFSNISKKSSGAGARHSGTDETKMTADASGAVNATTQSQPQEQKKLDPADFIVSKRQNEIILREPGSIQGQQFIIEECKNCDIYLLDHSATVSIDECVDCRIFVGPCESSVFIRTTKACKIVVACQQLRVRDCHDLDLLLYVSASQPVIENSDTIRLGCFSYSYFGLARQFTAAGLHPWNGEWSNVHDFHAATGKHWSFLPTSTKASDLLKPLSAVGSTTEETSETIVPWTWGSRPTQHKDRILVIIYPSHHDTGYSLLDGLKEEMDCERIHVMRTRVIKCNKDRAQAIFGKKNDALVKQASTGSIIAMELCGTDLAPRVRSLVTSSGWQDQMHIDTDSSMINHVFEPVAV